MSASGAYEMSGTLDRPPTVLVVDDEEIIRVSVEVGLSGHFEVTCVADCESALAAIRRDRPDAMMIDVLFRETRMQGDELCEEIRKFDLGLETRENENA